MKMTSWSGVVTAPKDYWKKSSTGTWKLTSPRLVPSTVSENFLHSEERTKNEGTITSFGWCRGKVVKHAVRTSSNISGCWKPRTTEGRWLTGVAQSIYHQRTTARLQVAGLGRDLLAWHGFQLQDGWSKILMGIRSNFFKVEVFQ